VADLSTLTAEERATLCDLAWRYYAARAQRDYAASDSLRAELIAWGAYPPEHGWHPVFESPEHRYARAQAGSRK
jgi:hypothetical protein